MITDKILKPFFIYFFLFAFFSYHVDAKCEQITNELRTDGKWNMYDTFYSFSGGNITFTLTAMPCGASTLLIQGVSQHGSGFDVLTFNSSDLNVERDIATDVTADKQRQFRIQAKVEDFKDINCPSPHFSGELCHSIFTETPGCKNENIISVAVPIVTAIIGVIGGIAGVLVKQYFSNKHVKSDKP